MIFNRLSDIPMWRQSRKVFGLHVRAAKRSETQVVHLRQSPIQALILPIAAYLKPRGKYSSGHATSYESLLTKKKRKKK